MLLCETVIGVLRGAALEAVWVVVERCSRGEPEPPFNHAGPGAPRKALRVLLALATSSADGPLAAGWPRNGRGMLRVARCRSGLLSEDQVQVSPGS